MQIALFAAAALPLLPAEPPPAPDEGFDYMIVDAPRRVVAGDPLKFFARARPGNAYVVFADVRLKNTLFNGTVWVHLEGSAMLPVAWGAMPANGEALHSLFTPALPALDGLDLYLQGFCRDPSIRRGLGGSDTKTVTFHKELNQPLITLLTVDKIADDFNGSEPGDGQLTAPPSGFTVDVFFDPRGKGPIDPAALVITADQPLGNGTIPAGTNLASRFTIKPYAASGLVDSTWEFPANTVVTLTADVANLAGASAPRVRYTFEVQRFTAFNQPFAQRQLWFLDFDSHDLDRSNVPDYREDLLLFGLGNDATAAAGPSAEVARWTREAIQDFLRGTFAVNQPAGVNVDFLLQKPSTTFATICVGGLNAYPRNQLPPGALVTTGAAYLNPRNRRKDIMNCFGVVGVHPRSIHLLFKDVPAFQTTFNVLQQNPVGNDPDDPIVTSPGFDPMTATSRQRTRHLEIRAGVAAFANATGFVLVQETCHSMGLVGSGRLPFAQLGGEFYGHSTDAHIDDGQGNFLSGNNSTPAPAAAQNLALIWSHFQSGRAHFTPLTWAYLQERVINK